MSFEVPRCRRLFFLLSHFISLQSRSSTSDVTRTHLYILFKSRGYIDLVQQNPGPWVDEFKHTDLIIRYTGAILGEYRLDGGGTAPASLKENPSCSSRVIRSARDRAISKNLEQCFFSSFLSSRRSASKFMTSVTLLTLRGWWELSNILPAICQSMLLSTLHLYAQIRRYTRFKPGIYWLDGGGTAPASLCKKAFRFSRHTRSTRDRPKMVFLFSPTNIVQSWQVLRLLRDWGQLHLRDILFFFWLAATRQI
jgi:hypothetical protein